MQRVFHLGAHKTASTHLQGTLGDAAGLLRQAEVAWLGPRALRPPRGLPLEAVVQGRAAPDEVARLRAALAGPVILSEENVLGRALGPGGAQYALAAERLRRLLEAAGGGDALVLLAVRDPASWLVSLYSQQVVAGHYVPFEDFVAGMAPEALRWSAVVSGLRAVPGVVACVVWRFEDYPAVLPAVLRRSLPAGLADRMHPRGGAANPGLSARALDAIAAQADRLAPATLRAEAAALRTRFPKGPGVPGPVLFRPEALAASAAAYAADLERVAALDGVELLRPEG